MREVHYYADPISGKPLNGIQRKATAEKLAEQLGTMGYHTARVVGLGYGSKGHEEYAVACYLYEPTETSKPDALIVALVD